MDVPTATLAGLGQCGQVFAILFGRTGPFDRGTLEALYPGGQGEYLTRFTESLDTTIGAGFLLAEDRAEILSLAATSFALATR